MLKCCKDAFHLKDPEKACSRHLPLLDPELKGCAWIERLNVQLADTFASPDCFLSSSQIPTTKWMKQIRGAKCTINCFWYILTKCVSAKRTPAQVMAFSTIAHDLAECMRAELRSVCTGDALAARLTKSTQRRILEWGAACYMRVSAVASTCICIKDLHLCPRNCSTCC